MSQFNVSRLPLNHQIHSFGDRRGLQIPPPSRSRFRKYLRQARDKQPRKLKPFRVMRNVTSVSSRCSMAEKIWRLACFPACLRTS